MARGASSCTRARTSSARSPSRPLSGSISATSSALRARFSQRSAASSRCGSTTGRCSPRACYRHRELDLIANPEVRELFIKRAGVIATVREWLDERGFVEVETPVLQPLYGGALARPFTTHHNALDRDLYL